jgi:hypothetical protein
MDVGTQVENARIRRVPGLQLPARKYENNGRMTMGTAGGLRGFGRVRRAKMPCPKSANFGTEDDGTGRGLRGFECVLASNCTACSDANPFLLQTLTCLTIGGPTA